MTAARVPLVDLTAQYQSMKPEIDAAIAEVVAATAFVGTSENPFVRAFESAFSNVTATQHCIACANGTDAIEIVLRAAGVGPGDEVLVPAVSWIATSEAVSTCGATPVFVDVLPGEYTIDPDAAAAKLTPRTVAIIPVHLYGTPARMDALQQLSRSKNLFLLEDCAQAHGAQYRDRPVGSFGHAASFSFFPGKNLGAWGDAGAIVTSDEALARKCRMICQHGQAGRKHEHQIEGRNSRMDGIQAAVLSAKLPRLEAWTSARRRLAGQYTRDCGKLVEYVQTQPPGTRGVFHLFVVEVHRRESIISALAEDGITTAVHYPRPLPLLAAYERFHARAEDFPVASRMTTRILSLPLYPELSDAQQERVVSALRRAVSAAVPLDQTV